jgi:rhodanese-related sulfurtransferase
MANKVRKKVFIVNRSSHDFEPANMYGKIIFLSEGSMNRYATNSMIRQFGEAMRDSTEDDYIVPCSLSVMNSIACAIFAHKHGKLNLLLFKDGNYIERNHIL